MATSTVEDYLKHILLEEQRRPQRRVATGRVAELMRVAPGTVTAMVKTLADGGLLEYEPYSGVRLTHPGRRLAMHVLRRHRLLELFLVQILGMDWSEVHEEAETLEHAVSDRVLERMDVLLGFPSVDPHGDPIPTREGEVEETRLPSLLTCPLDTVLEVARVRDQSPEFLQLVERKELMPGRQLSVRGRSETSDRVEVELFETDRGAVCLGFGTGEKILVRPILPHVPKVAGT